MDRPTLSLRGYALLTALLIGALCAQALAADFQTGVEAFERGDFAAALDEWRPLAEQGLAEAQNNLGLIYDKGKGVPEDYTEAVKWYRKAAEQGYPMAQFNLGRMYFLGRGVPEDYTEAEKWFRKAAEQGNAGAQSNLGATYAHGWGVPQDYAEAVKWYRKAAEQGSARAQGNLGAMYYLVLRTSLFSCMKQPGCHVRPRLGRAARLCRSREVVPQSRRAGIRQGARQPGCHVLQWTRNSWYQSQRTSVASHLYFRV